MRGVLVAGEGLVLGLCVEAGLVALTAFLGDQYGHFVDMGTGSIFIGLALWMLGEGVTSLAPAR